MLVRRCNQVNTLKRVALALTIIGGINWGLIGFFQFDLVAAMFGGQDSLLSRVIYSLVGISSLYCLTLLFESDEETDTASVESRSLNYGTEFSEDTDISTTTEDKE